MAIHRAPRPDSHFTQIRNDVLRDDRLSYRARGILAVILSHSDGWSTSAAALTRQGPEGRDAIRSALAELEDAGYMVREKRQDNQGRWATHTVVYDSPQPDAQPGLFPQVTPETGFQASVSQASENQASVSQALLEQQPEHSLPTVGSEPKPKPPAQLIAEAIHDHAQGMVNFMAIRQVATRALKVNGSTVETVTKAMTQLYDAGRPITFQTVGQALSRGSFRETNRDHWANGGEF